MLHGGNIARWKDEGGFYREPDHLFTRGQGLAQGFSFREHRLEKLDGLEKGETETLLEEAVF